jgi:hypothetical protein
VRVATIELGELSAPEQDRAPELPVRTRRLVAIVLVIVACAVGLVAAVPGGPGLGEPLWSGTISLAGFRLGPSSLYLAEPNGQFVLAKDLRTGRTRWRLPIDELPMYTVDAGSGTAAVVTHMPTHDESQEPTVSLVNEATGRVVGVTSGNVFGPAGSRFVLGHQRQFGTDDCPQWGQQCWDIVSLDSATGAEAQRISLPADTALIASFVDGQVEAYASASADGAVRIYDAASGRLTDAMTVPSFHDPGAQALLMPDSFVIAEQVGDDVRVTSYRRGPLTFQWATALPAAPPGEYPGWWLAGYDCGPVICLATDTRTVLLDRATGAVRFTVTGNDVRGVSDQTLLVAADSQPPLPGPYRPSAAVVDAGTGVVKGLVNKIMPIDWTGAGSRALLAQEGPERTAFLLVRADGQVRTLGSVDGTGLNCSARDVIVACSRPSGELRVWRLPV